ncbi:MAG: hypothetical protein IIA07_03220 [Proteobacteria bacterium]|nr:hypothetical protein [Pseudomonadota bacterium]
MYSFCQKFLLAAIVLALAPAGLSADSPTAFARVAVDAQKKPTALQLAIVTYVPQSDSRQYSVDLVSAIHVGDEAYYAELNDRFENYDALLYELIAPKDTIVDRTAEEREGFISNVQLVLKGVLDLTFQLDVIDYDKANFVHADLSPAELSLSMDERDESLYVYFWRVFYATMEEHAKDPLGLRDWQILSAVLSANDDNAIKIMMAYEMTDLKQMRKILGDDSDSAVIGARNERAIEVLRSTLDMGTDRMRIGIFYGVAHMPDLEVRLLNELGLVRQQIVWIDAWKLGQQPVDAAQ